MTRAFLAAAFGTALCLTGAGVDAPSLYVPGLALAALGLIAPVWETLAATRASIEREEGPRTVQEEEPYP
ncbi:MAG: hypothetical protein H0T15_06895, partial [Thermoleophilaceae bacterium]|nr:hypothetical protein [Thermoleophilaceae bacterium]